MGDYITRVKELPIVKDILVSPDSSSESTYYGMNVSSRLDLEPLDQLDGFLVARAVQNEAGGEFYPFIAGVYEALNSPTAEQAFATARNRQRLDQEKRDLLLKNIMRNLKLDGEVLVTRDLWDDPEYWDIFREIIGGICPDELSERYPRKSRLYMKKFPKNVLGAFQDVVGSRIDDWYASVVYIPAEVAEAVWFQRYRDVGSKIGPITSERIYDDFIFQKGLNIIGLTQPVDGVPYIGKRGQNRVLFSDTLADIAVRRQGTPSFERALELAETDIFLIGTDNAPPVFRVQGLVSLGRRDSV